MAEPDQKTALLALYPMFFIAVCFSVLPDRKQKLVKPDSASRLCHCPLIPGLDRGNILHAA